MMFSVFSKSVIKNNLKNKNQTDLTKCVFYVFLVFFFVF